MPTQPNGDNLLIGRGKWYFNRLRDDGTYAGRRFIGEVSKGEINPQTQKKQRFTMTKASSNLIAENVTQQTHTLALELGEFTPKNLALGLLGDASVVTTTGSTVTNEVLYDSATGGAWGGFDSLFNLAKRNVTMTSVVATIASSPVTLALGADYEVEDATRGLIHLLPSSTHAGATVTNLKATYTSATNTVTQIAAGQTTQIIGDLLFIGDPVSGPVMEVEIWKARIEPSAAIALLSDDYANIPLTAECLDDSANHPNAPLYVVTYR